MKALFYKQMKLVAHPMTYAFLLCGGMVLIPSYPYTVSFFYVTMGIFFMFQNAREQRDADFSALLPVRKRDTVTASVLFVVCLQTASIAITAPFCLLSASLAATRPNPDGSIGNLAGMDANAALLGMGFLLYAVFNTVFLPAFYRNGYRVGKAFLKASIAVFLLVGADVLLPHLFPWLDGQDPKQLWLTGAGAGIYFIATFLAYRRSVRLYEQVDL